MPQPGPTPLNPEQRVSFGTSGHRGIADGTFTEQHILAITQAICEYRRAQDRARCSWERIRTRFPDRRSGRRWKCWRRMAFRL